MKAYISYKVKSYSFFCLICKMYPKTDYRYFSRRDLSVTNPNKAKAWLLPGTQSCPCLAIGYLRASTKLLPVHSASLSPALHCLREQVQVILYPSSCFSQLILFIKQYLLSACWVRSIMLIWDYKRQIKQRFYLQQT